MDNFDSADENSLPGRRLHAHDTTITLFQVQPRKAYTETRKRLLI